MATKKATKKTAKKSPKKKAMKKAAPKKTAKKVAKAAPTKTAKKASAKMPKKSAPKMQKAPKPAAQVPAPMTMSDHPLIGQPLPDLTLPNQDGSPVSLGDLARNSRSLVLYFYPKDDTPGCTAQACGFRDNINRLTTTGATVVGVSPDSPESHKKFIAKYGLNFDLLSDSEHQLAETLRVWKEKKFMGNTYMGVERSTFIVDGDGQIQKAWQPVQVEGHVDEVIKSLG